MEAAGEDLSLDRQILQDIVSKSSRASWVMPPGELGKEAYQIP